MDLSDVMDLAQRLGLVRTGWREISLQSLFCLVHRIWRFVAELNQLARVRILRHARGALTALGSTACRRRCENSFPAAIAQRTCGSRNDH